MSDEAGIDTDVVLKGAAWGIGDELLACLSSFGRPAILGVAHIIAPMQLARVKLRDQDVAHENLADLLARLGALEPSDVEVGLAAELTAQAQQLDLPLDAGEAQLVAITMTRPLRVLATGDKRAITALARIVEGSDYADLLEGRLACLEQLLAAVGAMIGNEELRSRVCGEPLADGAMRLACSCDNPAWEPATLSEALESFIGHVRASAGRSLIEGLVFP